MHSRCTPPCRGVHLQPAACPASRVPHGSSRGVFGPSVVPSSPTPGLGSLSFCCAHPRGVTLFLQERPAEIRSVFSCLRAQTMRASCPRPSFGHSFASPYKSSCPAVSGRQRRRRLQSLLVSLKEYLPNGDGFFRIEVGLLRYAWTRTENV